MLRTIHRRLGLALGLLLLITFGSGMLTAVGELTSRPQQPRFDYSEPTLLEMAEALELISSKHQDIRQVTMPNKTTAYNQARLDQHRVNYSVDDLVPVEQQEPPLVAFFQTILQLHRNFLLGKNGFLGIHGADYVAWVSLLMLLISAIGLWLWWPLRSTFKLKKLAPTSLKRYALYYSHLNSGVVISIALILLSLTGASITYRAITEKILGADEHKINILDQPIELADSWHSWLSAIAVAMPNATLARIQFPRQKHRSGPSVNSKNVNIKGKVKATLTFRLVSQDDWLGLPNTKIQIEMESSTILSRTTFKDLPMGAKIMAVLVPLHTGRGLPRIYVAVLLLISALGVLMVVSGIASFLKKKVRKSTKKTALARL